MKKIKDIYEGKELSIWEDEEFVNFALCFTTISVPKEYWGEVEEDLKKFVKLLDK